jgi:hypothetical protein
MKLTIEQYADITNKDRARRGQLPLTDSAMKLAYRAYIAEMHYAQLLAAPNPSYVESALKWIESEMKECYD